MEQEPGALVADGIKEKVITPKSETEHGASPTHSPNVPSGDTSISEAKTEAGKTESKRNDHLNDKKFVSAKKENAGDGDQKDLMKEDDSVNKHASKFSGAGLWEQIRDYTRILEIDEESDFYWPEIRRYTEDVIEQLYSRRILFIQSISEDWLLRAVQRLASVVQTCRKFEKVQVRITQNSQVTNTTTNTQLEFGFWTRQRRLAYPVIIFISASRYDFLQKFLDQRKETVLNEFISELKKLNLYLVCEVENSVINQELFANTKSWVKDVYAFWKIPVVKLQILQNFGKDGTVLYDRLESTGIITPENELRIFNEINKRTYTTADDILVNLPLHLQDNISDIGKRKETLKGFMEGDDFIKQVVIFCGTFFNSLYYPDFFKLVSELLEGETKDIVFQDTMSSATGLYVAPPAPFQLRQSWEKNADRYLKECMLKTIREGGNQRVDFIASRLSVEMSAYIGDEQYPFFHRIYKKFEKAGLLTNLSLSEKMEYYVIRFFAQAARMDTNTHDAWWLKSVVHGLWRGYADELTTSENYEKAVEMLKLKKAFAQIVFDRIPLIISGLLANNNDEYREIIKHFFRLLLNEDDAKKMAIIIASYLYKEYRLTETFSTEDLMSYFRHTLDKGNWEESFFSYDALRDSMSYTELWDETNTWIENKDISEGSWTKQFAYLYQLDFILETFYRYFRQFKGEGIYEIWASETEGILSGQFRKIMSLLLSDQCQESLTSILENPFNADRFALRAKLFEGIESDKIILVKSRFFAPYNTANSLIADVLETWFYILTHKKENLKPDCPMESSWEAYVQLLQDTAGAKLISKIKKYWASKLEFYTFIIQGIYEDKTKADQGNSYKKQLQKRRISLTILKNHLQYTK